MEIVLIQVFFFTVLSKQKNKNKNENTEYHGTFILFKNQLESKRSFKNFQREHIVHDDNNLNGNILGEKKKKSTDLLSWTASQVLLTGLMNLTAF